MKKLVTLYIYPPIPDRSCDWMAYIDGEEENQEYGYGETEEAAIANFMADYEELLEN